jgi:hypothetical protein
LIDELHSSIEEPAKNETVYSCLDWLCRGIKYEHERGHGWLHPGEAITKGEADCEEQA